MTAMIQTFASKALPNGFSSEGEVKRLKTFSWAKTVKNGQHVDPGMVVLPQTSDYFCLVDNPTHTGGGVRKFPGADMSSFVVDHNDGFRTYGNKGARLVWSNVIIPPGGVVQFHYVFLRGQWVAPFKAFAQFLAVDDSNQVARKVTFAQSDAPGGSSTTGNFFRWSAHPPIAFPGGFAGSLQWVVSNGETRPVDDPNVSANADRFPSALAIDFISIVTP